MEELYVCTKKCFTGRLCKPGDVVTLEVAKMNEKCFHRLMSKSYSSREAEIEKIVPEIAELHGHTMQPISNVEMAKSKPVIVGGEALTNER